MMKLIDRDANHRPYMGAAPRLRRSDVQSCPIEAGDYYLLKTICPLNFQKVDDQVHPNILFHNCRLLKKIQTYSEPKLRLSKLAAKQDYVWVVHLTQLVWSHIFSSTQ